MSQFTRAIPHIIHHEVGNYPNGGYTNDPDDPGGATKWGWSLRTLKSLPLTFGDIDGDGDIDIDDIKALSQEQAQDLYLNFWWKKFRYDDIEDQASATKVFDLCVNMGSRRKNRNGEVVGGAHLLAQQAVQACGILLVLDGLLGPKSKAAINEVDSGEFEASLCSEAAGYYRQLITANYVFNKYRRGWMRRAYWRYPQ